MATTYEDAPDHFIQVNDIRFAYRRLGQPDGIPLVLLMHFRGTMDHWDPALVNPLAELRPVVLIDNAGVGRSGGQVPKTFGGWARHYIDVMQALGIKRADVMGFSMGGCVAQMIALDAPRLVRCLVLCGTIPSTGEGVTTAPTGPFNRLKDAMSADEQRDAFLSSFFTGSARSQAAGRASWDRISASRPDRSPYVSPESARRQAIAFAKFMDPSQAKYASFDRLHELELPVLIANGSHDLLLPTDNSIVMWKKLRHADAQLHLYPDAGHGFLYQYAGPFAALVNNFLDSTSSRDSHL
ncbi:alpha/beta hydrolase fold domain-containing protein [Hirsutella rhossiliensis]|uniref:Alpha/beta hydrolase fold domain-containing protein n=1 Tax=Hirsutella rhossiliensis TaxID=111463 RepID=A0A9P8MXR5_9HYPO|nr:alpha/beta hydrolase fold domain-containing protein [Hirsutella rhossiliensis]KAH0964018.1 alpha/beta hydrolase fold domain-containing protein [Hirsutella rhossiliensis]